MHVFPLHALSSFSMSDIQSLRRRVFFPHHQVEGTHRSCSNRQHPLSSAESSVELLSLKKRLWHQYGIGSAVSLTGRRAAPVVESKPVSIFQPDCNLEAVMRLRNQTHCRPLPQSNAGRRNRSWKSVRRNWNIRERFPLHRSQVS